MNSKYAIKFSIIIFSCMLLVAPISGLQICGTELADALAAVCRGRGYNMAFKPEVDGSPTERRFKRGIVDECCRRGCSWSTFEAYCSPVSNAGPDNLQIRKRSELPGKKWQDEPEVSLDHVASADLNKKVNYQKSYEDRKEIPADTSQGIRHNKRKLFGHTSPPENAHMNHQNRYFSTPSESKPRHHNYYKYLERKREHTAGNKVKRNDIRKRHHDGSFETIDYSKMVSETEGIVESDEFIGDLMRQGSSGNTLSHLDAPSKHFRHHRERLGFGGGRHSKHGFIGHNSKEFSGTSSQIGTVSPYFLGRTLVMPSSRKLSSVHH